MDKSTNGLEFTKTTLFDMKRFSEFKAQQKLFA